jgi:hypothetical protein
MKDIHEYDIHKIENYNKMIYENEDEIYLKYSNIIIQYLLLGIEKIKNHNSEYIKYILIKGMFTVSYVFKMLLMYTCNLQLTYHQCQKSYSYYTEFIGQIGDESVTYLQLNSKDAALFVYKKTIFDISSELKKKYTENDVNEIKNKNISIMIDMYNKLLETEITLLNSDQLKNSETIDKIYTSVARINSKLCKLYYSCESQNDYNNELNESKNDKSNSLIHESNIFYNKLSYIKRFCDIIISKKMLMDGGAGNETYKEYMKMIEYFIKKIRKMNNLSPNFEMIIISKSFSEEFEEKLKSCSTTKFINWLF